ncbi:MAG TPA: hypothetical protein VLV83_16185 [Acidobacteriota bacterium]|nr:hypothetical protein [Acidobacteriota bacterium]
MPDRGKRLTALATIAAMLLGASSLDRPDSADRLAALPQVMIWAWERPEDLEFLDCSQVGVAYLAGTLTLTGEEAQMRPRFMPLLLPPECRSLSVVRIETYEFEPPRYTRHQRREMVEEILALLRPDLDDGLQIDFDARSSEWDFYRRFLQDLRREMPAGWPLSITALTSWCLHDDRLEVMPLDEAVPMLFRMGPDKGNIIRALRRGRDFRSPVARTSYGLSTDEPFPPLRPDRRIYLFNPAPWDERALRQAIARVRQASRSFAGWSVEPARDAIARFQRSQTSLGPTQGGAFVSLALDGG